MVQVAAELGPLQLVKGGEETKYIQINIKQKTKRFERDGGRVF